MKSAFAFATLMMSAAIPSAALAQTQVTLAETAPVVTLNVTQSVEGAPDIATVSTGVETRAMTAKAAMSDNATKMTALIAAIAKAGIARKDIQTSGINLSAQYDYNTRTADGNQGPPKFIGYQASNTVSVKLRDVPKLGDLLDRMVAAGATNINGPTFSIDDPAPLLVQARAAAMKSAKAQAEFYAQQAGYRSARLVSIAESSSNERPIPMMVAARFKGAADSTPVEPGQVSSSVTLTVQYALEK